MYHSTAIADGKGASLGDVGEYLGDEGEYCGVTPPAHRLTVLLLLVAAY